MASLDPATGGRQFIKMSTLTEIEDAIQRLSSAQVDSLIAWLEKRRASATSANIREEPDFFARAKRIWGENPPGETLSHLVMHSRR